jgi:hypothetical protein
VAAGFSAGGTVAATTEASSEPVVGMDGATAAMDGTAGSLTAEGTSAAGRKAGAVSSGFFRGASVVRDGLSCLAGKTGTLLPVAVPAGAM